jgi:hypothetical protein
VAIMGGIEIVVPDGAEVDLDGFAIMGGRENKAPAPTGDGPLVRVNGYAVMGAVVVRPAKKRERTKHPVDDDAAPRRPTAVSGSSATPAPRRKPWVGRVIGWTLLAALALGPGRAAVTADARAVFGGAEYRPSGEQLNGQESVDVFSLFGGVDVVIPEGYKADLGSFSLFGGTSCKGGVCEREGTPVEVNATAIFGGVNVGDGRDNG